MDIVRCCDENTPHVAYCEAGLKALIDQRIGAALANYDPHRPPDPTVAAGNIQGRYIDGAWHRLG